jgi:Ala-tRNA(Pro) deacylase
MELLNYLEKRQCPFKRIPHHPMFSAQRLAEELGVKGAEVAKPVLLRTEHGGFYVVAVVPASKRINLSVASQLFNMGPLQFATEIEIAERFGDCEFGVVSPFGARYGIHTLVDSSFAADGHLYFEGTTHSEAICVAFTDYQKIEKPTVGRFTDSSTAASNGPGCR